MNEASPPMEGTPLISPSSTEHPLYNSIVDACRNIFDPELIYTIEITEDNDVNIIMSLTAPGCPVAGEMPGWVEDAINGTGGVRQVAVDLTWEPPWGMDMMSDEARLELGFM